MRGDRPRRYVGCRPDDTFTPHARGSTFLHIVVLHALMVYPACAGIDLQEFRSHPCLLRLPRMRGDRPVAYRISHLPGVFTPHARGSTVRQCRHPETRGVYPACAGIDPTTAVAKIAMNCLPRMRGDRPGCHTIIYVSRQFTPHARGST